MQCNFPENYFDAISCCFAIYYVKNLEEVILEFKRILKPGGRIFLAGPTPENAQELRTLHHNVTQKPLPYMPGISRFMSEVLSLIKKHFQNITIQDFQNPMVFQSTESFLDYYTSTGLYLNGTENDNEREDIKNRMKEEVQKLIKDEDQIEIKKVVGGILAYK